MSVTKYTEKGGTNSCIKIKHSRRLKEQCNTRGTSFKTPNYFIVRILWMYSFYIFHEFISGIFLEREKKGV